MSSARTVLTGDGAFWAGQLSHIGVVLVAIGISVAANLGAHTEVELAPGDSTTFAGYTVTYESPFQQSPPGKTIVGARMTVTRESRLIGIVEPSWNFFGSEQSAVGTPDVLHRPDGDLYFTLRDLPDVDNRGSVIATIDTSPLIWVLWLGGVVTVTGGFLAMRARRREPKAIDQRQTVDV